MGMYLANGSFLGRRLIGYEVYDSRSRGFIGLSEKQALARIKGGERIYGFTVAEGDAGERLMLDKEGFGMEDLQIKKGTGTLEWLNGGESDGMGMGLIVVRAYTEGKKRMYETVNARHARMPYEEEKLRMMMELGGHVAGVRLEKNRVVPYEGVEVIEEGGSGE